jgi:hypothetical protein
MMTRLRSHKLGGLLYLELPPLAVSLIVAELLFKFGSFTLEAVAFLGLWYVLSAAYVKALSALSQRSRLVPPPERF